MLGPIPRIMLAALITVPAGAQTSTPTPKKSATTAKTRQAANNEPRVSYADGLLTVVANNSSLAETLAEIRTFTNAKVEGIQPSPTDRISGEFGPDSTRAVLTALLANSHYNFILVSLPTNPNSVQRIVLSEPAPEPVVAMQAPVPQPAAPQPIAKAPQSEVPSNVEALLEREVRSDEPAKKETTETEAASREPDSAQRSDAEPKPVLAERATPAEPRPNKNDNVPASSEEDLPTVPATVEVCGVTYEASQLATLKVPDHCDKPVPNAAGKTK